MMFFLSKYTLKTTYSNGRKWQYPKVGTLGNNIRVCFKRF